MLAIYWVMEFLAVSCYSLSCKTVNTRKNFWTVDCFATNQMRDETTTDNCQTTTWISHNMIRNNELAFSSTTNLQTPNYQIRNRQQNLQQYMLSLLGDSFSATKTYGSKTTNHSQLV